MREHLVLNLLAQLPVRHVLAAVLGKDQLQAARVDQLDDELDAVALAQLVDRVHHLHGGQLLLPLDLLCARARRTELKEEEIMIINHKIMNETCKEDRRQENAETNEVATHNLVHSRVAV